MKGLDYNCYLGGPQAFHLFDDDLHPHKRSDTSKAAESSPRPWSTTVSRAEGGCLLTRNRDGSYHQYVPVHGWYYLGRFKSDREAVAVWKGRLRSMGVTA